MKQVEEEEKLHAVHFDHEFHSVNESKETVVGDVDTLFDFNLSRSASAINNGMIHERTLSTGAETPYYSSHSDGFDIGRTLIT